MMLLLSILINVANAGFEKAQYEIVKDVIWAADKAEVPRPLLVALCWGESRLKAHPKLTHLDGKSLSYDICQVKLETAQWLDKIYKHKIKVTPARLSNHRINAFYAAKFLRMLLIKYKSNWQLAVDAYNKGTAYSINTEYVRRFKVAKKITDEKFETLIKRK